MTMHPPANEPTAAALKEANRLFAQECTFVAGATHLEAIPLLQLPEIAFIGRSNVGKSSLINALTGRNTLAKVSHTPGRTKQLNFFNVGNRFILVDLPGYGYAKASKKEIAGWSRLMVDYLRGRVALQRAMLLIDSRHEIKASDKEMMTVLDDSAVNYQIVLTKTDKVSAALLQERLAQMQTLMRHHPALHPDILISSAEKGQGIEQIRFTLVQLLSERGLYTE